MINRNMINKIIKPHVIDTQTKSFRTRTKIINKGMIKVKKIKMNLMIFTVSQENPVMI